MTRGVNPEPFRRFAEFVADSKRIGRDIVGNPKSYVPLSALERHWTVNAISRVLQAFPDRLDIDVHIIKRQYLRVFSTLVYAGPEAVRNLQPLFISRNLTDDSFPRRSRPSEWPDEKFFRDAFKEFAPSQWQFFPLHFRSHLLQDRYVDDECVLPIEPSHQIAHSSTAVVERFDIHDELNHLEDRVCPFHFFPFSFARPVTSSNLSFRRPTLTPVSCRTSTTSRPKHRSSSKYTTTRDTKTITRTSSGRCAVSASDHPIT